MTIPKKLLKDTVDILTVSNTISGRSVTNTDSDVPAYISQKHRTIKGERGDRLVSYTVVFLAPDASISEDNEVVVDGKTRPVADLRKPKDIKGNIHHYEVELG